MDEPTAFRERERERLMVPKPLWSERDAKRNGELVE